MEQVPTLESLAADVGIPAALQTRIKQELAPHARIKQDQATEAAATV